jgi:hypothetical protein
MLLGVPIAASIYRLLKEDVNRQEAVNQQNRNILQTKLK